jgi:hypothetical protein
MTPPEAITHEVPQMFTVKIDVEPVENSDPMTLRFLIRSGIGGIRLRQLANVTRVEQKTYRVLIVGNTCVGKTSLLRKAEFGGFNSRERRSVSVEMFQVKVNGTTLLLYDSPG